VNHLCLIGLASEDSCGGGDSHLDDNRHPILPCGCMPVHWNSPKGI
jgi:hypothetical protein